MNIYLDIDGVIIGNENQPAYYAEDFIDYLVNTHDVYWLTTHCRNIGDDPVPMLEKYFDNKTVERLKKIKPTQWDQFKTDAIDFSQPFQWYDDQMFDWEKQILIDKNVYTSWIEIDLAANPEALLDYIPLDYGKP